MDFGLSTHLFHAERLGPGHLEAMAAEGFSAVEVFATRSHVDYHDAQVGRDLAAWCASAGVRLHSVHAPITEFLHGTTWGPPISTGTASAAQRARTIDECTRALALAEVAPYEHLVLHLGVPDEYAPPTGDNQRDAVLRTLEALIPVAERVGVRIAVEVIPNALSTARQLVRLIEDEELPHLGICLDVGHARLQGDVVDALETVAGYLVTTHLHDNRGRSDDHLVPFEGVIDWGELLIGFQKVGYDGTLLFELAAGADGAAATLRRAGAARRRMESLLGLDFAFSED
ncbi:sugar phosphate isomerase/epimerase family protein [Luteitalea sp.]|uniref:sugar phosphate isomerase/epimerase family protein n=1 Tax=Luteitalea sp. TaxID=2004800 RepID=UPI0037CC9469